jgi:NAD(P)-dependent dehydrogenase (short-subunit alcohol dehydrogenase family)
MKEEAAMVGLTAAAPRAVIVTGGTGALGQAVVLHLLALGTRVAVPYREERAWQALQQRAAAGDALAGFAADVSRADAARSFVEAAVSALGALDGLALVAGGWAGGAPFEQAAPDEWTRMLEQNLETVAHVCRAALPHLLAKGGSIVAVGSRAALTGGAGMAAYAVSKQAVHALVRVLALENRDRGVRVNAVLPGTIDTPANRRAMPEANRASWTSPEAIARTIAFLLSPDSAPVTGALLPVDGPAGG